jgi:hypothetical protein
MKTNRSTSVLLVMAMMFTGFFVGLMAVSPQTAMAQGGFLFRGARANGAGGITADSRRVMRGANGNFYKNGHGFWSNGAGNSNSWRAKGFQAPNGDTGTVTSGTTRSADGSLMHKSYQSYNGQSASGTSYGNVSRDSSGQVTGSKNTTATKANGSTYTGSTTYNQQTGLSRSQVCTNQYGETVPCP